jgi:2-polyprenyl-3-methyl-5-hydroxy-6-metoxy-1,4-benzoquinol methylase
MFVVAADLDEECVQALAQRLVANMVLVRLNANRALPFRPQAFDLVVIVHALSLAVLTNAMPIVRAGGHVIFETFGAHGENWRSLPRPREIAETLSPHFDRVVYRERTVRRQPYAVTVKALLRRI